MTPRRAVLSGAERRAGGREGGAHQAAANMAVVQFFLLFIVRRIPSKTEEYNRANAFSHVNILVVYLAALMINPAVTLDEGSSLTEARVLLALLLLQARVLYRSQQPRERARGGAGRGGVGRVGRGAEGGGCVVRRGGR